MAHAKATDLVDISEILNKLRELPIKEKSFGCFYSKGKGILHFHIKDVRRYGHVFDGEEWVEVEIEPNLFLKKKIEIFKKMRRILSL